MKEKYEKVIIADILEKVNKKIDPKLINMIRNFPNIVKNSKGYEP